MPFPHEFGHRKSTRSVGLHRPAIYPSPSRATQDNAPGSVLTFGPVSCSPISALKSRAAVENFDVSGSNVLRRVAVQGNGRLILEEIKQTRSGSSSFR